MLFLLADLASAGQLLPTQVALTGRTHTPNFFDVLVPADLDGDGSDELVATDSAAGDILVWGTSGLGYAPLFVLEQPSSQISVADYDGDGALDILAGINLLSGAAGFTVTATYGDSIVGQPVDLDGDGDLDVLGDGIWFENRLSASSFISTPIAAPLTPLNGVTAGDLDGDGDLDLYGQWSNGTAGDGMAWWENDGTGFIWTEHPISDANFSRYNALVDVDGDGDLDVLSARDNLAVTVMTNTEAEADHFDAPVTLGVPGNFVQTVTAAQGPSSVWLAVEDFDGTTFYEVTGTSASTIIPLGAGRPAWGDREGDGVPDLFLDRAVMTVWSAFPTPVSSGVAASALSPELSMADLDGDLDLDLLVVGQGSLSWHENLEGTGAVWSIHDVFAEPNDGIVKGADRPLDLDSDGDLDLLAWSRETQEVLRWSNDGTGHFSPSVLFSKPDLTDLSGGDLDGDGAAEVVVGTSGDRELTIWTDAGAGFVSTLLDTSSSDWSGVTVTDVDLDGDEDIVADNGTNVFWYENRTGLGNLWNEVDLGYGYASDTLVPIDLDLDGDLDVVGDGIGDDFACFEQTLPYGQQFFLRNVGGSSVAASALALADTDLDGDLDVVTAHDLGGVQLYTNDSPTLGVASFSSSVVTAEGSWAVAAGDADGDTDPDLLIHDFETSAVILWRNDELVPADDPDSDGVFAEEDRCPTLWDPLLVDADGDEWPDACDCSAESPEIHPEAEEICDGLDQDCDGSVDEPFDVDGDGRSLCGSDGEFGTPDDDCDDGDADVHPGASDLCDGFDTNCDGTAEPDEDLDGVPTCEDCADGDSSIHPGAFEIPYDGVDQDCDPATPDDDLDGDGYPLATDCADDDSEVHPGRSEVPYDGIDQDCDPATPDDDLDNDSAFHDEDCDDQDPSVAADCSPPPGGVTDTKDGCGCASARQWGSWVWLLAAGALALRSRERSVEDAPRSLRAVRGTAR